MASTIFFGFTRVLASRQELMYFGVHWNIGQLISVMKQLFGSGIT